MAEVPKDVLKELRRLRLWHWNEAMLYRKAQKEFAPGEGRERDAYEQLVGFHIKQVQLLNYWFSIGDTAEKDASE